MVSWGLPVGMGLGLMALMAGPAASIFTYSTPIVVPSEASASTRTLTVGIAAGAVYRPFWVIFPMAAFPPATPLISHMTAVLASPVTVAVYCRVAFTPRFVYPGVTVTAGVAACARRGRNKVLSRRETTCGRTRFMGLLRGMEGLYFAVILYGRRWRIVSCLCCIVNWSKNTVWTANPRTEETVRNDLGQ